MLLVSETTDALADPQSVLSLAQDFVESQVAPLGLEGFSKSMYGHFSATEIVELSTLFESVPAGQFCDPFGFVKLRPKLMWVLRSRLATVNEALAASDDPDTAKAARSERVRLYYLLECFPEALDEENPETRELARTFHTHEKSLGGGRLETHNVHLLVPILCVKNQYEKAQHQLSRVIERSRGLVGPYHKDTLKSLKVMMDVCGRTKNFTTANHYESMCRRSVEEMAGPYKIDECKAYEDAYDVLTQRSWADFMDEYLNGVKVEQEGFSHKWPPEDLGESEEDKAQW